jgi:MFS family permease
VTSASATRLPAAYWRLWAATAISTIGDGVLIGALPILATRVTKDRLSIGLMSTFFSIPWLLFALPVGAIIDRVDRKRMLVVVDLARGALIGGLALAAAFATVHVWMLWTLAFGLGVGEVFFDSTSQTILPAVVGPELLPKANGMRFAVETTGHTFVGAPLGTLLFAIAVWLPFGIDAASFVVSAVLVTTLRGRFRPEGLGLGVRPPQWRKDIGSGLRYLWSNRVLRNLALVIALTNLAFATCESTFVLFATQQLGVSTRLFGVLIAVVGAGSIAAGVAGGWLVNKVGRRFAIRVASFVPILTMLSIGTIAVTWWVVAMITVQAVMVTIWSIIAVSLRQRIVPDHMFGRVNSVFRWFSWGAMPVGALLGGLMAKSFNLRAPYFAGAAVMAVAYVLIIGSLRERDIDKAIVSNAPRRGDDDPTPPGLDRHPLDDVLDRFH